MKNNKIKVIILILIICIPLTIFCAYKYSMNKAFSSLTTSANKYMNEKEYDKAIALFEQALSYKKDSYTNSKLELAKKLKDLKTFYDNAINLLGKEKYKEAINEFNKITEEDKALYTEAKKRIDECKEKFISSNLIKSKDSIKRNDYVEAEKYIDEILEMDKDNKTANELKSLCISKQEGKVKTKSLIEKAKKVGEGKDYKKAINYLDEALNIESDNIEAATLKDKYTKILESIEPKKLTAEKAKNLVKSKLSSKYNFSVIYAYDHDDKKDGKEYYVIHAFTNEVDHIATVGWYYVNKKTSEVYEWDLANDALIPIN